MNLKPKYENKRVEHTPFCSFMFFNAIEKY